MSLRRTGLALTITAALLMSSLSRPEAAKPAPNPGCAVRFADRAGDAIRSDTSAPYANGTEGIECQVWTSGSQDVTLRLPSKGVRRFSVDYRELAGQAQVSSPPTGITLDGWFLNVRNIGAMAMGSVQMTQASVQASGDGFIFRFCGGGSGACAFGGGDIGSTLVSVTRHSGGWSVTTDGSSELGTLYQPFRGSYRPIALYRLPWALEVSCPTCAAPVQ